MTKRFISSVFIVVFALVFSGFAFAEGDEPSAKEMARKTRLMMHDLMQELSEVEKKHFYMAYSSYNLIQTVRIVQDDVSKAIGSCGENNSEMEADLEDRFALWNDAINPLLQEAGGNLNNMILAQAYAPSKDIEAIFAMLDKTRQETNSQINKIPVTTPEACRYLLEKMNETQSRMISLLKSALVSFPKAFPETPSSPVQDGDGE